jgi:hypothetical protein
LVERNDRFIHDPRVNGVKSYCTLWSINQQPFNRRERMSWSVVVICFPLIGVLAYLPQAWYNAATGALSFWKKPKKKKKFYGY